MNKIRIAGAVASKSGITLYLDSGKQMELPKTSHRTNEIMKEIAAPLARKKIVEIDLDAYSFSATVEKKTGGLIRFAIEKAKNFLGLTVKTGGVFDNQKVAEDETVVAHVGGKKIPSMQALSAQIERAAFTKDCKGFKLFMNRLTLVIDERGHEVQELLNFMEKADLPIADDGSIVAYKTLDLLRGKEEGTFVDKHSHTVQQRLGSRVSMPMERVDSSRRVECSTGLHIARRQYLSGYMGDVVTLVKVAPEDVIAVPHGEPDKMRAMAYHIVAVLPVEARRLIANGNPMTSHVESAQILANVIAGDHVGVLEEVRIGGLKKEPINSYDKEIQVESVQEVSEPYVPKGNGVVSALDSDNAPVSVDIKALNKEIEAAQREAQTAENIAVITGDLSAALNVPDAPKKKAKKKAPVAANKTVAPKPTLVTGEINADRIKSNTVLAVNLNDAQQRREEALTAVLGGMSQREAAAKFKVCAKTLRKMVRERQQDAAE